MIPTLGSTLNGAQLCRANNWTAGTMLIGEPNQHSKNFPGNKSPIIWITAVGHSNVFARGFDEWSGVFNAENSWYLSTRNWQELPQADWPAAVAHAREAARQRLDPTPR